MRTIRHCLSGPILLLTFALLFVSGCGESSRRNSSEARRPIPVRVGYPPIVASLPFAIAQDQGLFSTNDVTVEATVFVNSNDMLNSLVAKQIDLLPAVSLIPIIQLEIQYPGIVRLFSHSRMRPEKAFDSIIVKDNASIHALSDLQGKKIGVFPGTSASNLLKAFLKKHGVSSDNVTLVQLAPPAQLSALQSGAVDALFTYEPVTTTALKAGAYRSIFGSVYADLLNPCPVGTSVISRNFERKYPEAAKSVIQALDQATLVQRNQPAKARPLIEKLTKTPADIAAAVNVVDITLSDENDAPTLQRFIDLLFEIGEIPERIKAERLLAPTN